MAVPKKKISRSRGKRRYSKFQRETRDRLENKYATTECSNCKSQKLPHFACKVCGTYNGRDVLQLEKKEEQKSKKIKKIKA